MSNVWRRYPEESLLVEPLGDATAVYCVHTGDTHLIDAFPLAILDALRDEGPLPAGNLSQLLAELLDETPDAVEPRVRAVLASLELMQLVECTDA